MAIHFSSTVCRTCVSTNYLLAPPMGTSTGSMLRHARPFYQVILALELRAKMTYDRMVMLLVVSARENVNI